MGVSVAKTLLWGYHPVFEALRAGRRRLHCIYLAKGQGAGRREAIAEAARQVGVPVQRVTLDRLTAIVGHARHQAVAAEAGPFPESTLDQIVSAAGAERQGWVLLLDQVVDPQNFGAIVRTAHCAGMHGVITPKDRSAPPSAAACKASAGALEHMPVAFVVNLVGAMRILKESGFWIAGADRRGSHSLFGADLKGHLALVIGAEEKGLRPLVKQHCDFTLAIPQTGPVGSLNASAAAAVIIYEAYRQRMGTD